jgi:quinol monooxygenase YgiN
MADDDDAEVPEVELTIVTLTFEVADEGAAGRLLWLLSKYVVLSRMQGGCRNIDLCQSVTTPGRFLVIEKWETPDAQRAHFDSKEMVEMAQACDGLLTRKPEIDLLEGISAHDLK